MTAVAEAPAFLGDLPRTRIVYEQDLATPAAQQDTLDRACAALGAPPAPARSSFEPVTPRSFGSFILNWSDIETRLADSAYARFLDRAA